MRQLGLSTTDEVPSEATLEAYHEMFELPMPDDMIEAITELYGWSLDTIRGCSPPVVGMSGGHLIEASPRGLLLCALRLEVPSTATLETFPAGRGPFPLRRGFSLALRLQRPCRGRRPLAPVCLHLALAIPPLVTLTTGHTLPLRQPNLLFPVSVHCSSFPSSLLAPPQRR
jgi:hypothetical protein